MGVSWRDAIAERQKRWTVVRRFKANSGKPGPENSEDEERQQIIHAFFQKKRKNPATAAQLRLFHAAF